MRHINKINLSKIRNVELHHLDDIFQCYQGQLARLVINRKVYVKEWNTF